jgi:hypothetical protein
MYEPHGDYLSALLPVYPFSFGFRVDRCKYRFVAPGAVRYVIPPAVPLPNDKGIARSERIDQAVILGLLVSLLLRNIGPVEYFHQGYTSTFPALSVGCLGRSPVARSSVEKLPLNVE